MAHLKHLSWIFCIYIYRIIEMDMAQTPLPVQLGGIQVVWLAILYPQHHLGIIFPSFSQLTCHSWLSHWNPGHPWAPGFPEEFISGCLRLQGAARAVDLLLMTKDTRRGARMTMTCSADFSCTKIISTWWYFKICSPSVQTYLNVLLIYRVYSIIICIYTTCCKKMYMVECMDTS